jgi:hypothetical protein
LAPVQLFPASFFTSETKTGSESAVAKLKQLAAAAQRHGPDVIDVIGF